MKTLMVACSLLLLSGCASNGQLPWAGFSAQGSCAKPNSDQELSLNLADDMANEGKLHASLANLQNLPDNLPQVRQRQAKVYRLLGRSEAEPLYRSLLGTCMAAEGEHGLGQLAAARGDNGQAMAHLQRAARMSPTDEKIRNDLGVVYLNQRRLEDARFEFLTAMELKQSEQLGTSRTSGQPHGPEPGTSDASPGPGAATQGARLTDDSANRSGRNRRRRAASAGQIGL